MAYLSPNVAQNALSTNLPKSKEEGALIKFAKDQALTLVPPILATVESYVISFGVQKLKEAAGNTDFCPSQQFINNNVNTLNNLIENINKISTTLNSINKYSSNLNQIISVSQQILSVVNNLIAVGTVAELTFIPPAIPPGTLVGGVDAAKTARDTIFFDSQGSPRLPKISGTIQSMAFYIGIASSFLFLIQGQLNDIINVIQLCSKTPIALTAFNGDFNALAEQGSLINSGVNSNQQTQTDTDSYKGFNISIEEIEDPATGIIKRRAVGTNRSGIVLIQTPLSFTTNTKSLIDELKLIIDRDNLKAE